MKTYSVWKYPVQVQDHFEIEMPKGAKILNVGVQNESAWIWALCDPEELVKEVRRFRLAGTGHPIRWGFVGQQPTHLGSFMIHGGALVFHLFERSPEDDEG